MECTVTWGLGSCGSLNIVVIRVGEDLVFEVGRGWGCRGRGVDHTSRSKAKVSKVDSELREEYSVHSSH